MLDERRRRGQTSPSENKTVAVLDAAQPSSSCCHRRPLRPRRWFLYIPCLPLTRIQAHEMTSTGGLSRRRVAASSSSTTDDADDAWGLNGSSSKHTSTPSVSSSNTTNAPISHAGSAFQGGSKIAYDPRDLEREDEDERQGGKAPRLTIMEEVLLLGLKDKQVSFTLSWWGLSGCIGSGFL